MIVPDDLNVDVGTLSTTALVERLRTAKTRCDVVIDENGSIIDYVPGVAVYNWFTRDEEALKKEQQNRAVWCEVAREAAVELGRRPSTDVAASEQAAESMLEYPVRKVGN